MIAIVGNMIIQKSVRVEVIIAKPQIIDILSFEWLYERIVHDFDHIFGSRTHKKIHDASGSWLLFENVEVLGIGHRRFVTLKGGKVISSCQKVSGNLLKYELAGLEPPALIAVGHHLYQNRTVDVPG